MKILETERLILRGYNENDFNAVHSYASCKENVIYMIWGPNTEEQTREFISNAIKESSDNALSTNIYAVTLKDSGKLIGGCDMPVKGDGASLGWVLHRDFWKQGYGTEVGRALLKYGFEELNLRRITATCDCENTGSYKLMEKIGMRREGCFFETRSANKNSDKKFGDEYKYAILRDEWEIQKETEYYNNLPCEFTGFFELPELSDGLIRLVCEEKKLAVPEKKYVPAYSFAVCKGSEKIGGVSFRIGYTDGLFYGGQIGYNIDEKYRGNGYAVRACRLLLPVARAHKMEKCIISNEYTNTASRRVCEKLGARLLRLARIPEWNDLYKEGKRFLNIFEWSV